MTSGGEPAEFQNLHDGLPQIQPPPGERTAELSITHAQVRVGFLWVFDVDFHRGDCLSGRRETLMGNNGDEAKAASDRFTIVT